MLSIVGWKSAIKETRRSSSADLEWAIASALFEAITTGISAHKGNQQTCPFVRPIRGIQYSRTRETESSNEGDRQSSTRIATFDLRISFSIMALENPLNKSPLRTRGVNDGQRDAVCKRIVWNFDLGIPFRHLGV